MYLLCGVVAVGGLGWTVGVAGWGGRGAVGVVWGGAGVGGVVVVVGVGLVGGWVGGVVVGVGHSCLVVRAGMDDGRWEEGGGEMGSRLGGWGASADGGRQARILRVRGCAGSSRSV